MLMRLGLTIDEPSPEALLLCNEDEDDDEAEKKIVIETRTVSWSTMLNGRIRRWDESEPIYTIAARCIL